MSTETPPPAATDPHQPQEEHEQNEMMGHIVRKVIPILVLAGVIAAAWWIWSSNHGAPGHEAATEPQGPTEVHVVTLRKETVPVYPRFLGQTEGSQVVEIRSRVSGYLLERAFKEGDPVKKGQKLFVIDPRPFEVDLAQAKARLVSSEATHRRAEQQVKRYEELRERNAAPQAELEEWQMQAGVAAAEVNLQKAMISSAELQLSYTTIEAPVDGVIGQALKDVGSYVDDGTSGQLAVLQQVNPIYVRYSLTEQEMLRWNRLQRDGKVSVPELEKMELTVTLSDGSIYPLKAKVNFIDVALSQTTGTTIVRGTVPNPDGALKPGQFIYASPLDIKRLEVLRVPQKAVIQSPTGASVYVANAENIAETRPVQLGEWSGEDYWIIEAGLKPGDRVVIDRLVMMRPGTKLAPTEAPAATQPTTAPID